ncbi:MAG: phosphoribosylformylglycinamidine synthase subunit PurL [Candidatus Omnitrophica bacterium]|nr:phosphoribosylformylglycinamidine synthase subunit PurL [Candidatus Omnitrophota bacterium]
MIWRVEIKDKESVFDAVGQAVACDIQDLGITSISKVLVEQVFLIDGQIASKEIHKICRELLVDPVVQDYVCFQETTPSLSKFEQKDFKTVEIAYNPGVMDPVEKSTLKGIKDLGIMNVSSVRTAKKYLLFGKPTEKELDIIIKRILSNKLIQHVVDHSSKTSKLTKKIKEKKDIKAVVVDILNLKDEDLLKLSQKGQLFLNLNEMREIQKYFRKLKRNPTDCEVETIAQTWSEHCHHKTFRGDIEYTHIENGKKKTSMIRNLLKSTIVKATYEINAPWCVSVFHDNSGVIKFDKDSHVCFKVETHNHPSALEPFGGANTGIGGVIRDSLGTGLGAKPICNTDIFCFASPEMSFEDLPEGSLHPKRVMKGVVNGVRDYGNKMGIPTVNGSILFDERFVGNPLVYCGTVGILPKDKVEKEANKGDLIVSLGGRTGRDGIHGATFSSGELTEESETVSSGAVQIGDPIQEKKTLDVLLQARDQNLYTSITDCGAGGFSSAVGEMAEKLGCRVDLDKAPTKYDGLTYEEIWISESQERMVISVPKKNIKKLLALCSSENVEATVIGEFTSTKRLEIFYKGVQVCDLDMKFLYDGIPKIAKKAIWQPPKGKDPKRPLGKNLTKNLESVLSHYNVCSKENVVRRYDHEVQGGSVIKPFVGINCDGPSDASVVRPKFDSKKGIAISNGINVRFGMIDPYWMAASCIDEAIRQIIVVGGRLDNIAILDNFCWGNPDKPDRLGSLVRAAQGCRDVAIGYKTPFISGKDSFYNEYAQKGKTISIPGTILISAMGLVDDVEKTVTMDFKEDGNLIYVIGDTFNEMGGSIYLDTLGSLGMSVPKVNTKTALRNFKAVEKAIAKKLVRSAHDCSEGGLAVAISEMAFSGGLGATISLKKVPYKDQQKQNDVILFSESNSRIVVEVEPKNQARFELLLKGVSFGLIGRVKQEKEMTVYGLDEEICIKSNINALKQVWQKTLRW